MGDVAAVLLVPAKGDPLGLLRKGPCRARPPMVDVYRYRGWLNNDLSGWMTKKVDAEYVVETQMSNALVLAWDGEPAADGFCRLAWRCDMNFSTTAAMVAALLKVGHALTDVLTVLSLYGTVVFLDVDGRELCGPKRPVGES